MGPPPYLPMGHPPYMGAGPSHATDAEFVGQYSDGDTAFIMEDLFRGDFTNDFDIIGPSQLGGAPLHPSQDVPTQTPVAGSRPQRAAGFLDRFTYSAGHVHAHQRGKRDRTHRSG